MIVSRGLGRDTRGIGAGLIATGGIGYHTFGIPPVIIIPDEGSTPGSRRRRKTKAQLPPQESLFPFELPVVVEGVGTVIQLHIVKGYSTPLSVLSPPLITYAEPNKTEEIPALLRTEVFVEPEVHAPKQLDLFVRTFDIAALLRVKQPEKGPLADILHEVVTARGLIQEQEQEQEPEPVVIASSKIRFGLQTHVRGVSEYVILPETTGALEINEEELVFILDLLTRR